MTLALEAAPYDANAADAFAANTMRRLDDAAVVAMMSLGHRLGLFDVVAQLSGSSASAIAERAGLAERYVREWLAVMVTGRIIEYDAPTRTYRLPPERAACLAKGAPLGNLAVYAQHVALMGAMQQRLVQCFENGSGIFYDEYPDFHRIMAEDSAQTVTARLFEHVLPLVPRLSERLAEGIDVLDVGCGRGSALIALAERFPHSRFIGYDLCDEAIRAAATAARSAKLENLQFAALDMSDYDECNRFDLVTSFDAVHDQKNPQRLIGALRRALRSGGTYLMQDIGGSSALENNLDFPMASFLYAVSCVHCTPVSLAQGGAALGTMWGWETAEHMLRSAGFSEVRRHVLAHDPMNVWFVSRV